MCTFYIRIHNFVDMHVVVTRGNTSCHIIQQRTLGGLACVFIKV